MCVEKKEGIMQRIQRLEPSEYNLLYAIFSAFIGIIHVILSVAFVAEKLYVLAEINLVSIVFYIICMVLSQKKKIWLVYHMIIG